MLNVQSLCQVVLTINGEVPEILGEKGVKLIKRGKRKITQITMDVSPEGEITNPLGMDFDGKLGVKVLARIWKSNHKNALHYAQVVCGFRGEKLQPLYVNGEYAIFRYWQMALVQTCLETQSVRIVTLRLKGNHVEAEEVLPWVRVSSPHIKTRGDAEKFLREFVLKAANKSQYLSAVLEAMEWMKRATQGQFEPAYFLTREEVATAKAKAA